MKCLFLVVTAILFPTANHPDAKETISSFCHEAGSAKTFLNLKNLKISAVILKRVQRYQCRNSAYPDNQIHEGIQDNVLTIGN